MGNQLQRTPPKQTIIKTDNSIFLQTHSVVQRQIQSSSQILIKQQFIVQSKSMIEQILHKISKSRPFSNIISVKQIIKKQHQSICSQSIPVYLYYKYYPNNLRNQINKKKQNHQKFTQQQIWFIINQISRGIYKLYEDGISHWDIRPQTVFKDQNDNLYLIDSSYFIHAHNLRYFLEQKIKMAIGNLAPEIIEIIKKSSRIDGLEDMGMKNDMYSFGITILQIVFLRDQGYYYNSYGVSSNKIEQDLYLLRNIHKNVANFIRKLLTDQKKRTNIQAIRNQLKPQQNQILRTVSNIQSSQTNSRSSQPNPIRGNLLINIPHHYPRLQLIHFQEHHYEPQQFHRQRVNSFQSPPKKIQFRSPQKLSLTSIRNKVSIDKLSPRHRQQSSRQYILYSPRINHKKI